MPSLVFYFDHFCYLCFYHINIMSVVIPFSTSSLSLPLSFDRPLLLNYSVCEIPGQPRFQPGQAYKGDAVGTPEYLAPEAALGVYNEKVDIFSTGVLGYLCLYGRYPDLAGQRSSWPKWPVSCLWKRPCNGQPVPPVPAQGLPVSPGFTPICLRSRCSLRPRLI